MENNDGRGRIIKYSNLQRQHISIATSGTKSSWHENNCLIYFSLVQGDKVTGKIRTTQANFKKKYCFTNCHICTAQTSSLYAFQISDTKHIKLINCYVNSGSS